VSNALGLGEKDSRRITVNATGKRFGYLKNLVEVLDSNNIPILSLLSIPTSKKDDWSLIFRLKAKHVSVAVEDLKKKGFDIADVT